MVNRKKEFLTALAIVVTVYVVLAIPYALKAHTQLILLKRLVVLAFLSGAMLIWWLVRYRQISRDLKMSRAKIERKRRDRNESEQDNSTLGS